ncbi:hypothetical protein [Acidianus sp. HS-5]|uniref:hypothetical protein n=1 Tax=Acidianus sp. HS-5 TaxID=2886040 RepID=UPI001F2825A0|nr:hypothetical protein [Acidianus sp. HS-5]BDC17299.1 hypothetical protein HS5_01890 [Acidianus sp. HS-5]
MSSYKNKVILFRSVYSTFFGFVNFGYVAIMSVTGLSYAQISLLITLSFLSQTLSYFLLVLVRIKRGLVVSSLLNLAIPIILVLEKNFLVFLIISIISGFADALFSAIVVIQKDFTKKDYSIMMSSTFIAQVIGLGLYYFSSYINLEYLLAIISGISFIGVIISLNLSYEEEKPQLKGFVNFLKTEGKFITALLSLATLRRVFIGSILSVVFISAFSYISKDYLSLYFAIFQLPLVFFLYFGHKISNKVYLVLTLADFLVYISLVRFYSISPIIFLGMILLIKAMDFLRSPLAEAALLQKMNYSTTATSFFSLLDSTLSVITGGIFTALISLKLYSLLFLLTGLSSLSADLLVYRLVKEYKE